MQCVLHLLLQSRLLSTVVWIQYNVAPAVVVLHATCVRGLLLLLSSHTHIPTTASCQERKDVLVQGCESLSTAGVLLAQGSTASQQSA